jgi:hypothetical protein
MMVYSQVKMHQETKDLPLGSILDAQGRGFVIQREKISAGIDKGIKRAFRSAPAFQSTLEWCSTLAF